MNNVIECQLESRDFFLPTTFLMVPEIPNSYRNAMPFNLQIRYIVADKVCLINKTTCSVVPQNGG